MAYLSLETTSKCEPRFKTLGFVNCKKATPDYDHAKRTTTRPWRCGRGTAGPCRI